MYVHICIGIFFILILCLTKKKPFIILPLHFFIYYICIILSGRFYLSQKTKGEVENEKRFVNSYLVLLFIQESLHFLTIIRKEYIFCLAAKNFFFVKNFDLRCLGLNYMAASTSTRCTLVKPDPSSQECTYT